MESTLSYDRLISSHRNKLDYQEAPQNTLQFAYEHRRYLKMTDQLFNLSDILQLQTLEELNEDYKRADLCVLSILSSDIHSVLVQHFEHKQNKIRQLSIKAVVQLCKDRKCSQLVMEKNYIEDIEKLINDPVDIIRTYSYNAMLNLSEFRDGAEHMLEFKKLIPDLVDKLIEEKAESILILDLELIKKLLNGQGGTLEFLQTPVIQRLTNLLDHQNSRIRDLAAVNLAAISFDLKGQKEIIIQQSIKGLCNQLEDPVSEVRESVTLALASLAQRNQGKNEILNYGAFILIENLLNDPSEQTKLNSILLITSLAEHVEGRIKSRDSLKQLAELKANPENQYLVEYIDHAVQVITWVP